MLMYNKEEVINVLVEELKKEHKDVYTIKAVFG